MSESNAGLTRKRLINSVTGMSRNLTPQQMRTVAATLNFMAEQREAELEEKRRGEYR